MSDASVVLIVMTIGTFALKSAGPLLLGNRDVPVRVRRLIDLLPAALLAALAVVATFGDGAALVVDARAAGLMAAGVALWRRAPFVVVVVVAAAVTALVRLV